MIDKVRACYADDKKAMFHGWYPYSTIVEPSPMVGGHNGGVINFTCGIVEFEDGKIDEVVPSKIRFVDGGEFFENTLWVPKEVLDNAKQK